ncbi:MAG: cobalt ECF transporter T component CbiQ [Actinobacteria bacterium]|nr:cobalt ECF transporter T component CbiQ [Actinomycetota bacterium]
MHGLAIDRIAWSSPWRVRSVRDKAALSLGLLLCAIALPPVPGSVLAAGVGLAVLLGPIGVTLRQLGRIGWVPASSILIGVLTVALSVSAEGELRVQMTEAGLLQAGGLALRAAAATLAMLVLACSTPVVDLFAALHKARVPAALIEIAALTYRFAAGLLDNAGAIHAAQVARLGYVSRPAAMRSASLATGMLFLRSWSRAQRLEDGLAGRGYTDNLRTLDPRRVRSATFLALTWALLASLVGVAVAWEVVR